MNTEVGMSNGIAASFKLFVRCTSCLANSTARLDVPNEDGAPMDVDDLASCVSLGRIPFSCQACHCTSAEIVAINKLQPECV